MSRSDPLRRHAVSLGGRADAQPMVFAHGFGCDQQMWRFVAPAFEASHRVVQFDHMGCGRSDLDAWDEARYASLAGYAADVVDIMEALDLRDTVLVGHSVSGVISLLAAERVPQRVAKIVMLGPSPRYLNDPPDYVGGFERADLEGLLALMARNNLGWASFLAPLVTGVADDPAGGAFESEFKASFCAIDPYMARRFAEATFYCDNREDLARVPCPALIVQCTRDRIAPRHVGAWMQARMPGSTLVEIDAAGHAPHMTHPRQTIDVIRDFLGG